MEFARQGATETHPVRYCVTITGGVVKRINGALTRQGGELFLVDGDRKRVRWEKAGSGDPFCMTEINGDTELASTEILKMLAQVAAEDGCRVGRVIILEPEVARGPKRISEAKRHSPISRGTSETLALAALSAASAKALEEASRIREFQTAEQGNLRTYASHLEATAAAMRARDVVYREPPHSRWRCKAS